MSYQGAMQLRLTSFLGRSSSFARTSRQLQTAARHKQNRLIGRSCLDGPTTTRPQSTTPSLSYPRRGTATSTLPPREKNASQQAYEPPTTGLLSRLPSACVPYAELIRLDKPAGTYYLFLPCLFSTILAAPLAVPMASPATVLSTSALFLAGAVIMRGAGCTVNDLWDRNLDPHVARTRLRPIARGAVTVRQAVPYLGAQLLCGLGVLLQFPQQCLFYGVPSLFFVAVYPLAKRVTNYPQFVLGLTFSWGAIMGFPALGVDLLSNTSALVSAACLYGSCVAWTVVYDMIYAYQDIRDDAKAGIKSIALAQEANAKAFLTAVSAVQVALLAGAGAAVGVGPVYFVGTCGGAAATLAYMIRRVNLSDVKDCWAWFRKGAWLTGGAISLGMLGEYSMQYFGLDEQLAVEAGSSGR